MPNYPDQTDIIYDISHYIMLKNKKKKKWNVSDMKISGDDLSLVFTNNQEDSFKAILKQTLQEMMSGSLITVTAGDPAKAVTSPDLVLTKEALSKIFIL